MRLNLSRAAGGLLLAGLIGCGSSPPAGTPTIAVADAAPEKLDRFPSEAAPKVDPAAVPPSETNYTFPDDAGGKALEKVLAPTGLSKLPSSPTRGPIVRLIPSAIEAPTLLASPVVAPPRLPLPTVKAPRPSPPPEHVPTGLARGVPELPVRIELPVGTVLRLPSPDPRTPAALPTLAQPVRDRASLDDPTAEFSTRSVTGAALPIRDTLATFVKVNLPDPFEHSASARLQLDLAEDPNKALGSPTPPKP